MFLMGNRERKIRKVAEDIIRGPRNGQTHIVLAYADVNELIGFSGAIGTLARILEQETQLAVVTSLERTNYTQKEYPVRVGPFFRQYHIGRERTSQAQAYIFHIFCLKFLLALVLVS